MPFKTFPFFQIEKQDDRNTLPWNVDSMCIGAHRKGSSPFKNRISSHVFVRQQISDKVYGGSHENDFR